MGVCSDTWLSRFREGIVYVSGMLPSLLVEGECDPNYCVPFKSAIIIIIPHECTRGKVISLSVCVVVVVIGTKITRSWDIDIWASCKQDQTVKCVKNWLGFGSNWQHGSGSPQTLCWPRLSNTPTVDRVVSAHYTTTHLSRLAQCRYSVRGMCSTELLLWPCYK